MTLLRRTFPLLFLITLILLLAAPILTYPLGRDQGEFATIGRGILNGRVPYVDLWNPKPPAVFYVYALAMGVLGKTSAALRAIDLLIFPPAAIGLYWLGSKWRGRALGLLAVAVFAAFYFTETFWTLTQNDGIVLLPMILAAVCALKAAAVHPAAQGTRVWAFLCGALCALTLWFKYPFLFFVAAISLGYLIQPNTWRGRLQALLPFGAGGLLIGLGGIAYLAAIGAFDAWIESALVTSGYTALSLTDADLSAAFQTALGFRWSHWGLLFVLAAVGLVGQLLVQRRSAAAREDSSHTQGHAPLRFNHFIFLWLLGAAASMVVQAKFYDYHWLPLLPPLALFAALGLSGLIDLVANAHFLQKFIESFVQFRAMLCAFSIVGLLGILMAGIWSQTLPFITGQQTQAEYFAAFQGGEFNAEESLLVAEFLRQRVAPGDSLYIWGFRPEIYFLSDLYPATRFIFQFPLVGDWYPQAWQQENVDVLWAALPPYVLVLQGDYMPWVTGSDDDSHTLLQAYTELNNWLIANYEQETQIGNFLIWKRKS